MVLSAYESKPVPRALPDIRRARCVKVYDGDTISVIARHGRRGRPRLYSVRLRGIDAPEMNEGSSAIRARTALCHLVLNKACTLEDVGSEK